MDISPEIKVRVRRLLQVGSLCTCYLFDNTHTGNTGELMMMKVIIRITFKTKKRTNGGDKNSFSNPSIKE